MKNLAVLLALKIAASIAVSMSFCVLLCSPLLAQDPPGTDIYLAEIFEGSGGELTLGKAMQVTDREGYDNQPHFSPSGSEIYYTSIDASGQADIWIYDVAKKTRRNFTQTAESEYSPTPIPGQAAISTIRVEKDESQKLWQFPLDGSAPSRILDDIAPVGYHAWSADGSELVLFVLGEPHELQRVAAGNAKAKGRVLAKDIGRALHRIPGKNAFSFLHKEGPEDWWIKKLDIASDEITPMQLAFTDREDFTWSPETLWSADGGKIYRWCMPCGGRWKPVADLEASGLTNITRMSVDPERKLLAFVADRPAKAP